MASAVIETFFGIAGLTLTVDLYPLGSDTAAASGIVLTEATNRKGLYTGTTTAGLTGEHQAFIKSGTNVVGLGYVVMSDDTAVHRIVDSAAVADKTGTSNNVGSIDGSVTAATRLSQMFAATRLVTVDSATLSPSTTAFETDQTVDAGDRYTEQVLFGLDGNNVGVTVPITAYAFTNSKVKLTVEALPTAPSNGHRFLIMGRIEQ